MSEVRPQPARVTAHTDRVVFAFEALPGSSVTFTVQPNRLGSRSGTVTIAESRPVQLQQFVYP